ncbi:MAG: cupin domain-containing protein [Desulfuromonas sp.]|nr:MAG: cupin domain-containing protein [Desulfuromonas sp.]
MFNKKSTTGYEQPLDKIDRKTIAHGEKTLLSEFLLKKGAQIPVHSHPHEQTGYLVVGKVELTIGTDVFIAEPGDAWCIHGGVDHSAGALEDSVIIEAFAPVREDYLP